MNSDKQASSVWSIISARGICVGVLVMELSSFYLLFIASKSFYMF